MMADSMSIKEVSDSSIFAAIDHKNGYSLSANERIVRLEKRIEDLSKKKGFSRKLGFSRHSKNETRIIVTKEIFESHLELFDTAETQVIFLANIFSPRTENIKVPGSDHTIIHGILYKALDRNPKLALELVELLLKGYKFHCRGTKISDGAIFCFQAAVHLQKYLEAYPKKKACDEALKILNGHLYDELVNQIDNYQKQILQPEKYKIQADFLKDTWIFTQLVNVHYMRTGHLYKETTKVTPVNDLKILLMGLYYKNILPKQSSSHLNTYLSFDMESMENNVNQFLESRLEKLSSEQRNKLFQSLITDLFSQDLLPDAGVEYRYDFPNLILQNDKSVILIFNLTTGKIVTSCDRQGYILENLQTNTYKKIFGSASQRAKFRTLAQFQIAEFHFKKKSYRVVENLKNHTVFIQHQPGGDTEWYDLMDSTKLPFPVSLEKLEEHYLWWRKIDLKSSSPAYYCTDRKGKPIQKIVPQGKNTFKIMELDERGIETGNSLLSQKAPDAGKLYAYLSRFEDPNFIEIWQHKNGTFKIHMLRYGLEWTSEQTKEGTEWIWTQNPEYRLFLAEGQALLGLQPCLYMQSRKTSDFQMIMPLQEYYPVQSRGPKGQKEEYRPLVFDVKDRIRKMIFQTRDHDGVPTSSELARIPPLKPYKTAWRSRKSERYAQFMMTSGKIIGNSAVDYLQLAYVALAEHHPEQALTALKECQKKGGIAGNAIEIVLIKRIMVELPSKIFSPHLALICQTKEPETEACRLFAALLLLEQKNASFNTLCFEVNRNPSLKSANQAYRYQQLEQARDFYHKYYDAELRTLYHDYFAKLPNIPQEMRLNPIQELSLLKCAYAYLHTSPYISNRRPPTEIANRMQKLLVAKLRHQKEQIRKKGERLDLSSEDTQLLQDLKREISNTKNQKVTSSSELCNKTYLIKLPGDDYLMESFKQLNFKELNALKEKGTQEVDAAPVSSEISQEIITKSLCDFSKKHTIFEFMLSFDRYYTLAKAKASSLIPTKALRADLENYVHNMLRVELCNSNYGDHRNLEFLLCRILCFVFKKPDLDWPVYRDNTVQDMRKSLSAIRNKAASSGIDPIPVKIVETEKRPETIVPPAEPKKEGADSHITKYHFTQPMTSRDRDGQTLALQQFKKHGLERFTDDLEALDRESDSKLKALIKIAEDLIKKSTKKISQQSIEDSTQNYGFLQTEALYSKLDKEAGQVKNQATKKKKAIYRDRIESLLSSTEYWDLKQRIRKCQEILNKDNSLVKEKSDLESLQKSILEFGNKALTGEKASLQTIAKVKGNEIATLSFEYLIYLYFRKDMRLMCRKTKLDLVSAEALNQKLHDYLIRFTAHQHRSRVSDTLQKLSATEEHSPEYQSYRELLGSQLEASRQFETEKHPELLVFEYYDDKLLRKDQITILKKFLSKKSGAEGYNSEVIQMIMAAGKSKIIMPILALMKADGTNLSIIEVPDGLFETCAKDFP